MQMHTKEKRRFCINLLFAIYNCVLGFVSHSWWFITVGAYYVILSMMRVSVIAFSARNRKNETFVMRFSGCLLLALSVVLCGIVYMTVDKSAALRHHEIVMITIALYAFTKLTLAIQGVVKARKRAKSPYIRTLSSIAFADAIVSIYSLQRSMLVSFGEMAQKDIVLFNTLSGIGMCIIVISIGINLIIGKEQKMAKSKLAQVSKKMAEGAKAGYKKIESATVTGYKKVEKGVTGVYTKIEDKFVDQYLTRDGETVEEAKKRLKKEN